MKLRLLYHLGNVPFCSLLIPLSFSSIDKYKIEIHRAQPSAASVNGDHSYRKAAL